MECNRSISITASEDRGRVNVAVVVAVVVVVVAVVVVDDDDDDDTNQRRIQDSLKHLRWSSFAKTITI